MTEATEHACMRFSAIKKKHCHLPQTWMDLEIIILSEISHRKINII